MSPCCTYVSKMCQTAWYIHVSLGKLIRKAGHGVSVFVCVCVWWRGARRNGLDEKLQQLVGYRVMSHNYFSTLGVKTERAEESQGNKAGTHKHTLVLCLALFTNIIIRCKSLYYSYSEPHVKTRGSANHITNISDISTKLSTHPQQTGKSHYLLQL